MTLKGDLDSISLADVFQTLSMTQQEGTMFVQDGESRKAIFFSKNGVSLITTAEKKGGKLGDMLVGLGKIIPEQLEEALQIHREADIRIGEALIRLGFVTDKDIEKAVRSQIEEEIYDLFSWENATFEFVEGPPPDGTFDGESQQVTQLTFNVNSLIMEAARRIDEWDLIEKVIPSVREIFVLDKRVKPLEYTDRERVILGFVEGRNTVKEIVDLSHVPKFEVCKFLYRLIEEGKACRAPFEMLLENGDEAVGAENLKDAVKFYEQALSGKIKKKSDQVKARLRLAQSLEYLDRKKEAADQYKVLANAKIEEKDIEGAINIWQKVIDLNPLDLENKERLINVYLENRGHLDPGRSDVIRSMEYSLFKNGKSLAMAFAYAGQIDRAKEVLHRLLELVPSNLELRKALANIHLDAGEKAEAVEELEQIAHILLANRDFDELHDVYKSIAKIDPSRTDIRKKISMIEAGEAVHQAARKGLKKTLLLVLVVLLVLCAGGGIGYYQVMARQEWTRVGEKALDLWKRSRERNLPPGKRAELRKQARETTRAILKHYPYAFLDSKVKGQLDKWEAEETREKDDRKAVLETQARRVGALVLAMEKIWEGSDPLDISKPIQKIDQAVEEAAENPYAETHLAALLEWKARFKRFRENAETLLREALAAEKEAESTKEYEQFYALAWKKSAILFKKGKRFPDLWNQIRLPIRFESNPAGVGIFVNDDVHLETPCTYHKLPNTLLRLKIKRIGYKPLTRQIPAEKLGSDDPKRFEKLCYYRFDMKIDPLAEPLHLEMGSVLSDPVAVGGLLFVANDIGDIFALRLQGEYLRKEYALHPSQHLLNQGFKSRLASSGRHVFFPCEDGNVYRVDLNPPGDPNDTLRTFDPAAGGKSHAIRKGGGVAISEDEKILVVGTDRGVTAFDMDAGKVLWQYLLDTPEDRAWAVPVCHEGKAYAGTDSGELLAFNLKEGPVDGKPLWRTGPDGIKIRSALAVFNGVLYAGTENGNIRYVELAKGAEGARRQYIQANTPIRCKPLFVEEFLFITAGTYLYKLRAANRQVVWRFDAGLRSGKASAPVRFKDSIFVGNGDGSLFSVDWRGSSAVVRWTKQIPGSVDVRPAVDPGDGTVYFISQDEKGIHIMAFRE